MQAHDDILDNLREQLVFLDKHPDFNESCTTLYIFEAIKEIKDLRKKLHESTLDVNKCQCLDHNNNLLNKCNECPR